MYGLGAGSSSAAQLAAWNALVCPSGYTKQILDVDPSITDTSFITTANLCVDRFGNSMAALAANPSLASYAATNTQANTIGKLALVGAVASVFLLPGWSKLLAIPLAMYGVNQSLKGYGF